MDIVGWILVGVFAVFSVLLLLVIIYFVWKRGAGSVKFKKILKNGNSIVIVQPFVNLKRVMVQDKAGGEELVFVRENIRSGERIIFEYPASNTPARLTTEGEANITMEVKP